MANYFDQFDNQKSQPTATNANFFDQFDNQQGAAQAAPAQPQQPAEDKSSLSYAWNHPGEAFSALKDALGGGVVRALAHDYSTGKDVQLDPNSRAGQYVAGLEQNPETAQNIKVVAHDLPRQLAYGGAAIATEGLAVPALEAMGVSSPFVAAMGARVAGNVAGSASSQSLDNGDITASQMIQDVATGEAFHYGAKAAGAGLKFVRDRYLPEWLGGTSKANLAAENLNQDYLQNVAQGGDQASQNTYRTATTNEAGESIVNPSQAMNAESPLGRSAIAQEQAALKSGKESRYSQNVEAQKAGVGVKQAIEQNAPEAGSLQQSANDIADTIRQRKNQLYTESIDKTQQILNDKGITKLKMPDTKALADQHLTNNANAGEIILSPRSKKLLTQFKAAPINDVKSLDTWKRRFSEAQSADKADQYFESSDTMKQVYNNLKSEADNLIQTIDPNAGSIYKDADSFYSANVEDFLDKNATIGKVASAKNEYKANKTMLGAPGIEGRMTGAANTQEVMQAIDDAVTRGHISPEQAAEFRNQLGAATRDQAYVNAFQNEGFNPKAIKSHLSGTKLQAREAGQEQVNQSILDAINTMSNKSVVKPTFSQRVGKVAGVGVGMGAGAIAGHSVGGLYGGALAAGAGAKAGAIATDAVTSVINKISRSAKVSQDLINFVNNNPETAQTALDILARRGVNPEQATSKEVTGIIRGLMTQPTSSGVSSLLSGDQTNDQPLPQLPTLPEPAPMAQPEPEQVAQAARLPHKYEPATRLYMAMTDAETGGLANPFIRTMAPEGGKPSTAWGPAQLTVTHATNFLKNHPKVFTPSEKDYLNRFIEQGNAMLHADPNDPVYGYGAPGVLTSPEDQRLYKQVAIKMMDIERRDNGGSYDKFIKAWRGKGDDSKYNAKIFASLRKSAPKAEAPARQGWGSGNSNNVFSD
ncbi:hypothetical protein OL383_004433 [Salmonella enterica]|nr:hypothetical protein [Salmonella enterica]